MGISIIAHSCSLEPHPDGLVVAGCAPARVAAERVLEAYEVHQAGGSRRCELTHIRGEAERDGTIGAPADTQKGALRKDRDGLRLVKVQTINAGSPIHIGDSEVGATTIRQNHHTVLLDLNAIARRHLTYSTSS